MPVGSTSQRSVQESGFASIGLLTPLRRLYPLPVRQASILPTASFRFHLAMDTLAVQLTLPLAGCVEDFHAIQGHALDFGLLVAADRSWKCQLGRERLSWASDGTLYST